MSTKMTDELTFNPNSMEVDGGIEEELGEYESYVDKLEAETAAADEVEDDGQAEPQDDGEDTQETVAEEEEVEEEVEEEAEEEEVEEEEVVDQLADPEENPMIPRERLQQESRKRQEEADRANNLERELAQMKAQMESAAETAGVEDIDANILKEAAEKALDGDTDAFADMLAKQFNQQNERLTRNQEKIREVAKQEALNEFRQEQALKERQDAASIWEGVYPELDPNSDAVNQEALDEAISLVGMYEGRGYSPSVAMERAVTAVAVNFDLTPSEQGNVTPAKQAKTKQVTKTKKATKKPVNQPPATGEASGLDSTKQKYDTETMSQDEWDALPDSVRDEILTGGV